MMASSPLESDVVRIGRATVTSVAEAAMLICEKYCETRYGTGTVPVLCYTDDRRLHILIRYGTLYTHDMMTG